MDQSGWNRIQMQSSTKSGRAAQARIQRGLECQVKKFEEWQYVDTKDF